MALTVGNDDRAIARGAVIGNGGTGEGEVGGCVGGARECEVDANSTGKGGGAAAGEAEGLRGGDGGFPCVAVGGDVDDGLVVVGDGGAQGAGRETGVVATGGCEGEQAGMRTFVRGIIDCTEGDRLGGLPVGRGEGEGGFVGGELGVGGDGDGDIGSGGKGEGEGEGVEGAGLGDGGGAAGLAEDEAGGSRRDLNNLNGGKVAFVAATSGGKDCAIAAGGFEFEARGGLVAEDDIVAGEFVGRVGEGGGGGFAEARPGVVGWVIAFAVAFEEGVLSKARTGGAAFGGGEEVALGGCVLTVSLQAVEIDVNVVGSVGDIGDTGVGVGLGGGLDIMVAHQEAAQEFAVGGGGIGVGGEDAGAGAVGGEGELGRGGVADVVDEGGGGGGVGGGVVPVGVGIDGPCDLVGENLFIAGVGTEVDADAVGGGRADDGEGDGGGLGPASRGIVGDGGEGLAAYGDLGPDDGVRGGGVLGEEAAVGKEDDLGDAGGGRGGGGDGDVGVDDEAVRRSGRGDGYAWGRVACPVALEEVRSGDGRFGLADAPPFNLEGLGAVFVEILEAQGVFASGEGDVASFVERSVFEAVVGDDGLTIDEEFGTIVAEDFELINIRGGDVEVAGVENGEVIRAGFYGEIEARAGARGAGLEMVEIWEGGPRASVGAVMESGSGGGRGGRLGGLVADVRPLVGGGGLALHVADGAAHEVEARAGVGGRLGGGIGDAVGSVSEVPIVGEEIAVGVGGGDGEAERGVGGAGGRGGGKGGGGSGVAGDGVLVIHDHVDPFVGLAVDGGGTACGRRDVEATINLGAVDVRALRVGASDLDRAVVGIAANDRAGRGVDAAGAAVAEFRVHGDGVAVPNRAGVRTRGDMAEAEEEPLAIAETGHRDQQAARERCRLPAVRMDVIVKPVGSTGCDVEHLVAGAFEKAKTLAEKEIEA